jgi:hypothetical protein
MLSTILVSLKYPFKLTFDSLSYHPTSGYSQKEIMEILEPLQNVFIDDPLVKEILVTSTGSVL